MKSHRVSEILENTGWFGQGHGGEVWVMFQLNGWTTEELLKVGPIDTEGCWYDEDEEECYETETTFRFLDIDSDGDMDVIVKTAESTYSGGNYESRTTEWSEQQYRFTGNRLSLVQ